MSTSHDTNEPLGSADVRSAVHRLHEEIDARAATVAAANGARITCHLGCSGCCRDDLFVFEVEARRIREEAARLLLDETPHPPGRCAFLSAAGACRAYEQRPYVCRTHGLPLAWLEEREDEVVELRDICPLNETDEPIETLPTEQTWEIGPFEEALQALQALATPKSPELRLSLRGLWGRAPADGAENAAVSPESQQDHVVFALGRERAVPRQTDDLISLGEGSYICTACREVIVVPIDGAAGTTQDYVEDCPVCCRPQLLHVHIEDDGTVRIDAQPS